MLAGERRHDFGDASWPTTTPDDAHGHAVCSVRRLRRRRRLPAVLPDARRRRRRRRGLREQLDGRQRPVHARGAAHRRGDHPRHERELAGRLQRRDVARPRSTGSCSDAGDDPDTAYNAMEAGEADTANIPPAARRGRPGELGHHASTSKVLGSYYYRFNDRDEIVGGEENKLLRQAISQAIDREAINEAVLQRARACPPPASCRPASPGQKADICEYCAYDPEAAQAAFDEWTAAGNSLDGPIPIQFNADAGHEDPWSTHHREPGAIGIQAERDAVARRRRTSREMADGAVRLLPLGLVRRLPDVRQLHVRPVPQRLARWEQHGFINDEFDALVDEAKQTTDPDAAGRRCSTRPRRSSSTMTIDAVPINWYLGDYAYNQEKITQLPADQLRSDQLGAGHAGRLTVREPVDGGGALRRHPPPIDRTSRYRHAQLHHPPLPAADPDDLLRGLVPLLPLLRAPRRPGDAASPAAATATRSRGRSQQANDRYGLDDPILVQFVNYWKTRPAVGPRRVVRQQPQRQRHPRREGAAQHPPGDLGDAHRDRRRHQRRAASRPSAATRSPTS